ncbi:MAG: TetR/AcrR family transcriptional regulator [Acidobacteria bacterium]|nr:MAG: TetR/AcrR family transcriptional regulator [Acidobacteriota bacterium]
MSATSRTKAEVTEVQTGVAVQAAGSQPSLVEHESPVPATLGKKGEMTRQQILSAALNLFRERGFDAATMRDIAESAGMSLGASYYYFPSKESIVSAYYDYVQQEHKVRVEREISKAKNLRQRLGIAFHTKLDIIQNDRRLLVALFRYGGDPHHPLSWFGPATSRQRELSMAVFAHALGDQKLPKDVRYFAPLALWALHMGLILYFVNDSSDEQRRTRRLLDGTLDLVTRAFDLATAPVLQPILRPIRKRVTELLTDAGLAPNPG